MSNKITKKEMIRILESLSNDFNQENYLGIVQKLENEISEISETFNFLYLKTIKNYSNNESFFMILKENRSLMENVEFDLKKHECSGTFEFKILSERINMVSQLIPIFDKEIESGSNISSNIVLTKDMCIVILNNLTDGLLDIDSCTKILKKLKVKYKNLAEVFRFLYFSRVRKYDIDFSYFLTIKRDRALMKDIKFEPTKHSYSRCVDFRLLINQINEIKDLSLSWNKQIQEIKQLNKKTNEFMKLLEGYKKEIENGNIPKNIYKLNLSEKCEHSLSYNSILTTLDLINLSKKDLLSFENINHSSMNSIIKKLAQYNVTPRFVIF